MPRRRLSSRPVFNVLRPRRIPLRRYMVRSAVALIYRVDEAGEQQLLFIERAHRPGDPWSGDMAFPGGRMEAGDGSPRAAAERETLEEIGLDLTAYGCFEGRLPDLVTRQHSRWRPMVVTPYVFQWCGPGDSASNHEVDNVVWIPLPELAASENQSTLRWQAPVGSIRLPCIRYQDYCIWGLSYSMLKTLWKHLR